MFVNANKVPDLDIEKYLNSLLQENKTITQEGTKVVVHIDRGELIELTECETLDEGTTVRTATGSLPDGNYRVMGEPYTIEIKNGKIQKAIKDFSILFMLGILGFIIILVTIAICIAILN